MGFIVLSGFTKVGFRATESIENFKFVSRGSLGFSR